MKEKFSKLLYHIQMLIAIRLIKDDNQPAEIIPGLYLGSIGTALKKEALE